MTAASSCGLLKVHMDTCTPSLSTSPDACSATSASMRELTLDGSQHAKLLQLCAGHEDLLRLLAEAPHFTPATEDEVSRARSVYADDDIEIEDGCGISEADAGIWVRAWLYVRHDD
jgi:hypothetical protein